MGKQYFYAGQLIRRYEKADANALKTVLSDHWDDPDSICAHADPNLCPPDANCTVFRYILDLTERSIEICPEYPCLSECYRVSL